MKQLTSLAIGLVVLAFLQPAFAQNHTPKTPPNPVAQLQTGIDGLVKFLDTDHKSTELFRYLSEHVAPQFDFAYMAQSAAGSWSRVMTKSQQQRLTERLKQMFLSSLTKKLAQYKGQGFIYLPPKFSRNNRVNISVLINNPGNYPDRIDFRMHLSATGWKIYDVAASGVSAIAYYRSYFRRTMRARR